MQNQYNKVIMVDSLVGNDYALCLCLGLYQQGANLSFVVPENRKIGHSYNFNIYKWAPSKGNTYGKLRKISKYPSYLLKLFLLIIKDRQSVVHFQFFRRRTDVFFFIIMRLLGVRLVFTAHNIMPHERTKIDYFLQAWVYKASKKIIVHSEFIKKRLLSQFKIKSDKIGIIPHGNFDIYLPKIMITKEEARGKLDLCMDDGVLLFFGYIREYKGVDLLLEAFKIVTSKNKNIKLIIAGSPQSKDLENKFKEMIKEHSFNGRLIYHSQFIPSEEVAKYFIAADAVVLPYKNIDHSGIVHLAYSFSKPIIATPVGDFPETIEHLKSGYIVEKSDPECLADAVIQLFSDTKMLNEMGNTAKFLNDTKYSWSDIAVKTLELYKEV